MLDTQLDQLAEQFIANATGLRKGENIWLEWTGDKAAPLAQACMTQIESLGGIVHAEPRGSLYVNNILAKKPSDEELMALGQSDLAIMKEMDAYLRVGDGGDEALLKDFGDRSGAYNRLAHHEFTQYRINNTRWLVTRAPTDAFAKACNMSREEFDPFYLDACLFDYSKMMRPAANLEKLLADGKHVHIKGKGTDVSFSIEGVGAKSCVGERNIPDGEVYTAPVKGSANGYVTFGPSVYEGKYFKEIFLRYSDGKIVEAKSTTVESARALNKILDTDKGARYPGEFAIAFHPLIDRPVGVILFDEKIKGSFHIASGQCYKTADNGNNSAVHWDMIQIQTPEHGGGIIEVDGRIIRQDGEFTLPDLQGLNPSRLLLA